MTMKKWILALTLSLSILMGCQTAPQQLSNDWVDSTPGTIILTGGIDQTDFQKFYNETQYGLDHYRVILNTDGGEAQACTGIISRMIELQKQGVSFTTESYTKAYSAGAFIWMMGNQRVLHRGSQLMFHLMEAQAVRGGKMLPGAYGQDRTEMFEMLDGNMYKWATEALPGMDPMTRDTMLLYSGMTFFDAKTAKELGIFFTLVE